MTFRQTSPHAASVSMHARLIARISGFTSRLMTPWNCHVWRVVIFSVPLAYLGDEFEVDSAGRRTKHTV